MPFRKRFFIPVLAVSFFAAVGTQAQVTSELGIVDPNGTNPATGSPWAAGDTYHLLYVTSSTTDATSTDIADYNAFVQADAAAQTGSFSQMGSVNWFALGSTTSTDAIDNVAISGPVMNAFDSAAIATDAADMWDFQFTEARTNLDGELRNVWTGSTGGGVADGGDELGADNGFTRRHWSGWTNWVAANANEENINQREMVAISEELTMVPEPTSLALLSLGGLLVARRRRG